MASKGFGTPPKQQQPQQQQQARPQGGGGGSSAAKTPQQAADQALRAAARSAPKVRPVNPKEAARGKVDYVQVKDWAGGEAADLGDLQVVADSFSPAFSAGAGGGGGGQPPLYEQLARHAQYLESQGALRVALEPGAKPFLPFEQWQYSLERYRQYIADLAEVHAALEEALQLALSDLQPGGPAGGPAGAPPPLHAAMSQFSQECGLWRGQAARDDLAELDALAAAAAQQQQQQQQQEEEERRRRPGGIPGASQNAVAYGRYLVQMGRAAAAAGDVEAAPGDGGGSSGGAAAPALRLLAHAYALHVQQQCLGTRVGAAATERLGLAAAGGGLAAAALYTRYPEHVAEPLQELVRATDAAGRSLDAEARQAVMTELPRALRKATLVLAPLASL